MWHINYLTNLATEMHPMTDLFKSDRAWIWGPPQQKAFDKVKEIISSSTVLAFYDPQKPIVFCADASSYGIGGVLMQDHGYQLRPATFWSRTLTETVLKYAQIEKECLAAVWTCDARDYYVTWLVF